MQDQAAAHSGLEYSGSRAFYRPQGVIAPHLLVDLIAFMLLEVLSKGRTEVLVDITGVTGFDPPGPEFRRWAVQRWAECASGRIHVAVVARPEIICPEKTGLVVAAEEGLRAHISSDEREAMNWLDAHYCVRPRIPVQK